MNRLWRANTIRPLTLKYSSLIKLGSCGWIIGFLSRLIVYSATWQIKRVLLTVFILGTSIIRVKANDKDEQNSFGDGYGDVGYFLAAPSEYFNIDRVTGELTVKADLDREQARGYLFSLLQMNA